MISSRVNDILVFLSVVDAGSFVNGGKAFGLSRSTAGKAVARLEDVHGTRLLNRTTRALELTEEGRGLYRHGLEIRAAIEAADATFNTAPGAPRGTLRVTAPDAVGRRLLLPVVQRYMEHWPDMRIEVGFSDRIDNLIDNGFDLAIRVGVSSPDSSFISKTLLTLNPVLCASPTYLSHRGHPGRAEQLDLLDLLQFASRGERQGWQLVEEDGTIVRVQGRVRLRLDSAEALREAAMAGLGVALLPHLLVEEDLVAGRLEQVLPKLDCGSVPVVALYPHKRLLEPRVRHFIDMLTAHISQLEPGATAPD
ncbi:LysR family transcriptional regulator [uncultured Roseibium sp.]|uniref:LysR family transcriptional regulator n=1 Tax=uncultured Roseibium sp. TaxID=1936171 RepID=UPI002615191B|nr:LysR family transcriptional regulator [uncultured Roseibium sp.]